MELQNEARVEPLVLTPTRTRLFSVQPIGTGTVWVEALTSYIARLSQAHSARVSDLAVEVLEEMPNPYGSMTFLIRTLADGSKTHHFSQCDYSLNGMGSRTMAWVYALEAATQIGNLHRLSFLPYKNVFSQVPFRKQRAWCSLCFADWAANDRIIYEPLLWACSTTLTCMVHGCSLRSECPRCMRMSKPLNVCSRPGYCDHCGGWLGRRVTDLHGSPDGVAIAKESIWNQEQTAKLVEKLPSLDPDGARDLVCQALNIYTDHVAAGSHIRFAEYTGCPLCNIENWLCGRNNPRLKHLFRISIRLGIPIDSLFRSSGPTTSEVMTAREVVENAGRWKSNRHRKRDKVLEVLESVLVADPPENLSQLARRLGYANSSSLSKVDRQLAKLISERTRPRMAQEISKRCFKRKASKEAVRLSLEQALAVERPLSLRVIALQLGYGDNYRIKKDCPDLCEQIVAKRRAANEASREVLRRSLSNALKEIPTPSIAAIAERLSIAAQVIWRWEPAMTRKLSQRYAQCCQEQIEDLRRLAETALKDPSSKPLGTVLRDLGIGRKLMEAQFPEVGSAIAEKYRVSIVERNERRREWMVKVIRKVVKELYGEGLSPTVKRLLCREPALWPCGLFNLSTELRLACSEVER